MRVQVSPDVVFRDLSGEAVLLNLQTGVYYGLDPVGTRMWSLINEGRDLHAVVEALAEEYDAERSTIEADLLKLIAELRLKGLVTSEET
jgi:hypothetical protein